MSFIKFKCWNVKYSCLTIIAPVSYCIIPTTPPACLNTILAPLTHSTWLWWSYTSQPPWVSEWGTDTHLERFETLFMTQSYTFFFPGTSCQQAYSAHHPHGLPWVCHRHGGQLHDARAGEPGGPQAQLCVWWGLRYWGCCLLSRLCYWWVGRNT